MRRSARRFGTSWCRWWPGRAASEWTEIEAPGLLGATSATRVAERKLPGQPPQTDQAVGIVLGCALRERTRDGRGDGLERPLCCSSPAVAGVGRFAAWSPRSGTLT